MIENIISQLLNIFFHLFVASKCEKEGILENNFYLEHDLHFGNL